MALPQRKDDGTPRPALKGLEQPERVERAVSSGWRFGWWWVWLLVIVGIWFVGFGWGGYGGWLRHRPAQTIARNDAQLAGPGVTVLDATDKSGFAGRAFEIRNVPVQRQVSPRVYWIGSATNSTPTLLVLQGAADYAAGARLDVAGQVVKAPTAAQAQQQWGLSAADAQELETEGAYVQATEAQRTPQQ